MRISFRPAILAVTLLAGLIGCAHMKPALENIPLYWMPTNTIDESGTTDLTGSTELSLQVADFTDKRDDHAAIGENREDPQPRPVTTRDDVAHYVTDHVREMLRNTRVHVVDTGGKAVL